MMRLSTTRRRQQGSGLILVVFIIVVVVSFVAVVANQNQQINSDQLVAAVIGTRAEMAARSAADIEISRFYQSTTDGSCHTDTVQTLSFIGEGLAQCDAKVSCQYVGQLDNAVQVYQLEAKGQCQVGDWMMQRVIKVGVRSDS